MSYGGKNSYSRPSNPAEYGGGGSVGANYYDTGANFSDQPQQRIHPQGDGRYDTDFHQAVHQAKQHHGEDADSDHTSLFSQAIGFISEHKARFSSEEIDEGQVVSAHQTLYGGGGGGGEGTGQHDADTIGAGAALQALKMFTSGEGGGGGGGHDQNKLIGMAMAQAGKLWDQQNKHGSVATDKQSAVNSAAKMALKMYMKSDGGGLSGLGGPAGSGGPGLLNLASKFLK